jgi:quercetin dioxygenase-like cupin family protein
MMPSMTRHLWGLTMMDNECGGDLPCWAHLFDDDVSPTEDSTVVNLASIASAAEGQGALWTRVSDDLNVNLLSFPEGEGVEEHVNTEVDVLIIGVAGVGIITVDGESHSMREGHLLLVPKGARRSTRALSDRFAYLTTHRRRSGLWPKVED